MRDSGICVVAASCIVWQAANAHRLQMLHAQWREEDGMRLWLSVFDSPRWPLYDYEADQYK